MELSNTLIDNLKVLLLDLDGTLINSEKAFYQSFRDVLTREYDVSITMEDYKKYELEQNAMLINVLKERYEYLKDVPAINIMNSVYNNYLSFFKEVILEEEAKDNFNILKELKKTDLDLGLITTCRRMYLDILISQLELENLFSLVVAREDVKKLKPDSEAYLNALSYFHVKPSDCLAIEDSKRGIDSALNAGIKTVKVENFTMIKYSHPEAIECYSANDVLKRILVRKAN